jgi:hypothetical protein
MIRFRKRVDAALATVIVVLGVSVLYAQLCVMARLPFATLRTFSVVPLLIAAVILWKTKWMQLPTAAPARTVPRPSSPAGGLLARIGIVAAIAAVYAFTESTWLFWILAGSYLTVELVRHPSAEHASTDEEPDSMIDIAGVVGLCALAVLITAGTNRPDPDDAYFRNVATAAIEFPGLVPQTIDAIHRGGLPPVEQMLHLPETYGLLVGVLSSATGLPVSLLYYVILPPLWAVLATLANWLVLRHLLPGPRAALWGTALFVFLLVFWGDSHRSFGNFGFVRLYQSKGIYVSVVLPLIVLAALRFRERPHAVTWLTLALSQIAAVGLTVNGVVVAPLAAGLALVAAPRFDRESIRTMLTGVAASLPMVVVIAGLVVQMLPYLNATDIAPAMRDYGPIGSERAPLVLLALTLLPLLAAQARLAHATWITWYVWLVVIVIFAPPASILASRILGPVYSWRLFWAVPVPLLLSLAGGAAAATIGLRGWRIAAPAVAWCSAFVLAGQSAVSRNTFALANIRRPKVERERYAVAESTLVLARKDAPALLPERVAIYVPHFADTPPMIGVRELYLSKLPGFIPAADLGMRSALLAWAGGSRTAIPLDQALRAIDDRGIATVVFPEQHRDAGGLASALSERGFRTSSLHGFVIATKPE